MGELESELPDLHEALTPLRVELRSLFRGEVNIPRYGFDDAAVRSFLPPLQATFKGSLLRLRISFDLTFPTSKNRIMLIQPSLRESLGLPAKLSGLGYDRKATRTRLLSSKLYA